MEFDEYVEKYGQDVDGLFEERQVKITDVIGHRAHIRVELMDVATDIQLPPLDIWDDTVLIGLLRTAEDQGLIDLDAIDIDPENLDDAIRPLIGCILKMPVRLDQL